MKKVSVLALARHRDAVTEALGRLGAVHIETRNAQSPRLDALKDRQARLMRAFLLVPESKDAAIASDLDATKGEETAAALLAIDAEIKVLKEKADRLIRDIKRIEDWGNFDPQLIDTLSSAGVELHLCELNKDQMKQVPEDSTYVVVSRKKDTTKLIFVGNPGVDFEMVMVPSISLQELNEQLSEVVQKSAELRLQLEGSQTERAIIGAALEQLEKNLEVAGVTASMESVEEMDELTILSGFIPEPRLADLKDFAGKAGVGLIIEDPAEEDEVPTLTENPRAINIIKPVFQFMGTTPGYREQDISPWFLIFFTIFFAMIIGDAGYGSILAVIAIIMSVKSKIANGKVADALLLFDLLSITTVVWGAVTGNWFGYGPIADLPVLSSLVIPQLDSFATTNADAVTQMVQYICFVLGLVHLLLAHSLAFLKKIKEAPRIHAFADVGWAVALVGLYFLVLNVVISAEKFPVPGYALYLIIGGMVGVFVFAGQEGDGFFKGILRSISPGELINTLLGGVSAFADVISYIRLFAVGLASIEIAKSFNSMGVGMMESGIGGVIGGIVVLALGHTLNLVMGGLSVIVHGVRLKMLEFSSHIGNEWAGFEYKPFKN